MYLGFLRIRVLLALVSEHATASEAGQAAGHTEKMPFKRI